jgi:hypothetical protein
MIYQKKRKKDPARGSLTGGGVRETEPRTGFCDFKLLNQFNS